MYFFCISNYEMRKNPVLNWNILVSQEINIQTNQSINLNNNADDTKILPGKNKLFTNTSVTETLVEQIRLCQTLALHGYVMLIEFQNTIRFLKIFEPI